MIAAGIAFASIATMALASRKGSVAWALVPNAANQGDLAQGAPMSILLQNTTAAGEQRALPVQVAGVGMRNGVTLYTILIGATLDGKVQPWGYAAGSFQEVTREFLFPVIGPVRAV